MELNKKLGKHLTYQTPFELFLHEHSLIQVPYYLQLSLLKISELINIKIFSKFFFSRKGELKFRELRK